MLWKEAQQRLHGEDIASRKEINNNKLSALLRLARQEYKDTYVGYWRGGIHWPSRRQRIETLLPHVENNRRPVR